MCVYSWMGAYFLFGFQGRRVFEVGAYTNVGGKSKKYGILCCLFHLPQIPGEERVTPQYKLLCAYPKRLYFFSPFGLKKGTNCNLQFGLRI